MNCRIQILPTVAFPLISSNPNFRTLIPPPSLPNSRHFTPCHLRKHSHHWSFSWIKQNLESVRSRRLTGVQSSVSGDGDTSHWTNYLPKGAVAADKILRLISTATSSPICQFISSPTTFLHSVDPRIKLVWLLVLVVLPARSHITVRVGLVIFLTLMSIRILPQNVWTDQLGRVFLLSGILFVTTGLGSNGSPSLVQSRTPPPAMMGLPVVPTSLEGYSYVILKIGPLRFTRKGLSVASTLACLTFSIFQSVSLCLATTAPEELASALQWFMLPLTYVGVPVAEITLTLLLSLRFINIVFDEVRNVALGIVSRRINWTQLTILETIDVLFTYVRRIFKNIFSHAEQISQAMIVRGFRGDCNAHKIYQHSRTSVGMADFVSLLCLVGVISAAVLSECYLV